MSLLNKKKLQNQKIIRQELFKLYQADSECIANYFEYKNLIEPEKLLKHMLRLPRLYFEEVKDKLSTFTHKDMVHQFHPYPHYYNEKYLNEQSYIISEHKMNWSMSGAMSALRRQMIPFLKQAFPYSQGEGLSFLDLACGQGELAFIVKTIFPKARIVALDINPEALKLARQNLKDFDGIDFIQCDVSDLSFKDEQFDLVMTSFLMSELPFQIRKQTVIEAERVLKKKGFIACLESMQKEDFIFEKLNSDLSPYSQSPFWLEYLSHPIEGMFLNQQISLKYSKSLFFTKVLGGQKKS